MQITAHIFLVVGAIEPAQANNTLQLLEDVFKCNYEANSWGRKLLLFLSRTNYKQWLLHNDDLRAACEEEPSLCYHPDFVSARCREHPVQVIKTVRLRAGQVSQLLHNKGQTSAHNAHCLIRLLVIVAGLNIRIILLLRDPRAVRQDLIRNLNNFIIPGNYSLFPPFLRSSRNKRRWCNFGGKLQAVPKKECEEVQGSLN